MPEELIGMSFEVKSAIMSKWGTKDLIDSLRATEDEISTAMDDQSKFRLENVAYTKNARSGMCPAIEDIMAQLNLQVPEKIGDKKLTIPDKEAWLDRQKKENPELAAAYQKMQMVEALSYDFDKRLTIANLKVNNIRAVMQLRSAQLLFFGADVKVTANTADAILNPPEPEPEPATADEGTV